MKTEEIIEMARQAGFVIDDMCYVRFAKLVAAKEREACALECEDGASTPEELLCAKLIRARGEA